VVEAMSAGAVPIAPAIGGPAEIIASEHCGILCHDPSGFVAATDALMCDPRRRETLAAAAVERAREFTPTRFPERLHGGLDAPSGDTVATARFFLRGGAPQHAVALLSDAVDAPATSADTWAGLADAFYRTGRRELMRLALERRCTQD